MKNIDFQIVPFCFGHEIHEKARTGEKSINLGCFPVAYNDYRYFGLYYKGRKPSLNDVMKQLNQVIQYGKNICNGWSCDYTKENVRNDVKLELKGPFNIEG